MNPELDNRGSKMMEILLHLIDLTIGPFPVLFGAKTLNSFHQYPAIPGTVKDGDMARLGKFVPKTPEIMLGFFHIIRGGRGNHFITTGIHLLGQPTNITPFTGGI